MLKESFGHLWSYRSKTWARKFFDGWVSQIKWSRLKAYFRFARMVEEHLDGILAYCDKPISLGYLEATVAFGLRHPEVGAAFADMLKKIP